MVTRAMVALTLLVLLTAVAAAQTLESDFQEQLTQFHKATTLDAYKEVGTRDLAWDGAALKLLWAYWPMLGGTVDDAGRQKLLDAAKPLQTTGCTDPLVQYVVSVAYRMNGDAVEGEKWLRQAVEGYRTSRYPKARAWWAPERLAEFCRHAEGDKQQETAQWEKLSAEWLAQAAGEPAVTGGMQRAFWADLQPTVLDDNACKPDELVAALLDTPGADPWLAHIAAGERNINLAWRARTDKAGYEVTPEQWEGFEKHLKIARQHLVQAWKLHPEYPEAPSRMITVVMGAGEDQGAEATSTRGWFDRAVKAQFDYAPAYSSYAWSLRPRWGGSYEEMVAFGLECLNTGRFDTRVPAYFWKALHDASIHESYPEVWRDEGAYANVVRYFEALLARPPGTGRSPEALRTLWLGAASQARQYDEVLRLAGELGDRIDLEAFRKEFECEAPLAISEARAATGPLGADVRKAIKLCDDDDIKAAAAAFNELLARNQDPQVRPYLRNRAETLRVENALEGTEWVSLQPPEDFAGFGLSGGLWKVADDGSVSITMPADLGWWITCEARIRGDYELRGEFDLDSTRDDVGAGMALTYIAGWWPGYSAFGLYTGVHSEKMAAGLLQDRTAAPPLAHNTFLVRVRDRKADGFINDKQFLAGVELAEGWGTPWGPTHIAFYAVKTGGPEATVRFSNVEIRGLR